MSLTLGDMRRRAYDHPVIGPALGWYGTATSIAALSLTDPDGLGRTNYGQNLFSGKGVVILPNRDGTDREKVAGQIFADVLTLEDAVNYTQTYTNEPYEFLLGGTGPEAITIARLNRAAQDALRTVYFDTRACVGHLFADSDFGAADIDSWVPSSGATDITIEKSAEVAHNLPGGLYSVLAHYLTASQYFSAAENYGAQRGESLYIAALPIILTSGATATLAVWDETNNVQLGETVTVTGKGEYHLQQVVNIQEAIEVNIRLGGSAGSQIAWDCLPNLNKQQLNWAPLSWIDAVWKLYGIDEMTYGQHLETNVQRATTGRPQRWVSRLHYTTTNMKEDANPGLVQVQKSFKETLPDHDLFYYARRRESDRSELNSETDTTEADQDFYEAAFFSEVCAMLEARDHLGPQGTWRVLQAECDRYVAAQRIVEPPAAPQPRQVHRVVSV